jgi:hypothetical protein
MFLLTFIVVSHTEQGTLFIAPGVPNKKPGWPVSSILFSFEGYGQFVHNKIAFRRRMSACIFPIWDGVRTLLVGQVADEALSHFSLHLRSLNTSYFIVNNSL